MGWLEVAIVTVTIGCSGCSAEVETSCVGGDCTPYQPEEPPPSACYEGCDTLNLSGRTGDLPCAVDAVLDNCRRCHVPGGVGPFPLVTYEDTQQLYGGRAIWARLQQVVETDFMPLEPPLLSADEKAILLDDWACQCAAPKEPGEVCQ